MTLELKDESFAMTERGKSCSQAESRKACKSQPSCDLGTRYLVRNGKMGPRKRGLGNMERTPECHPVALECDLRGKVNF